MQAYVLTRYGDASAMEFRDVPEPTADDGQVLIGVRAAARGAAGRLTAATAVACSRA